jgi:hypothetical protein
MRTTLWTDRRSAGLLAIALSLAAAALPARAEADYVEHFLMFRSKATGNTASAEQTRRCTEHFADRNVSSGAISQLDYRVWGIEVARDTGLIVNDTAQDLGPGYLCSVAPSPEGVVAAQSYGYITLPGFAEIEFEGPCRPVPTVNSGETFFNCKWQVLADATKGIYGGFVSTNSVLNVAGVPGWPTGSIWTAYLVEGAP